MAALSVTQAPVDGGLPDLAGAAVAASALGDTAPVGPGRLLAVVNADAAPHTVTVATPGTVSGLGVADAVMTVAAGDTGLLPLPRLFAQSDGRAALTYDDVTSLSVAVLELGT
ncbi:hypothetical protein [Streptomyces fradiae]|uniref:hypothetical protein n=1 Tax=Streptomyces fradiae TaxID=1906 RepID=UPI0029439C65|nr:hypothetical protein [Streptomyces fradiae]WOI58607.1 hypothetical protein RYQ63_00905 [Streptomyces fradiae]